MAITNNWKMLKKVALIIAIISGIVGIIHYTTPWIENLSTYLFKPKFTFQFQDINDQENPVYEITEELYYNSIFEVNTDTGEPWVENFYITISQNPKINFGSQLSLQIVKNNKEETIMLTKHFEKNEVKIKLNTLDLYKYSGLSAETPSLNIQNHINDVITGDFKIRIITESNKVLDKKTIRVKYTPWCHSTQLSDYSLTDSSIKVNENLKSYVTVKNFGEPGKFIVINILYDSTDFEFSSLNIGSKGWWPAKTWGNNKYVVPNDDNHNLEDYIIEIEKNEIITFESIIPIEFFEPYHTYILEAYVIKKLPYLRFNVGDWFTSDQRWRLRDRPSYSEIIVLSE